MNVVLYIYIYICIYKYALPQGFACVSLIRYMRLSFIFCLYEGSSVTCVFALCSCRFARLHLCSSNSTHLSCHWVSKCCCSWSGSSISKCLFLGGEWVSQNHIYIYICIYIHIYIYMCVYMHGFLPPWESASLPRVASLPNILADFDVAGS